MSEATFRVRGRHVLIAMLLFFGAVIAVNVTFVVLAAQTFPGEDVRRSYLQGLNYNDTLAQRSAQAALGWRAAAALVEANGAAAVEIVVRDRDGRPIDGLSAAGELRWPTDARWDRALVFEARGEGRYVAALGTLTPGRWVLRARAERDAERALDFEAELTWPSSR